jgi:hypothetical protein
MFRNKNFQVEKNSPQRLKKHWKEREETNSESPISMTDLLQAVDFWYGKNIANLLQVIDFWHG